MNLLKSVCISICLLYLTNSYAQQGDRFVFTQLKYCGGNWDPRPEITTEILRFMLTTTSIRALPQRRIVTPTDKDLFYSPFLVIAGEEEFTSFTADEIDSLRRYILGGGIIFIDDSSGRKGLGFDASIRREFARILPGTKWDKLPKDNVVLRSFYLLRTIGGRRIINNYLEGINISGRTVIIYSQNDVLGAWVKDKLGNYLYSCLPGGEPQRIEAMKLTANIIMYSLTGTYKSDYIHQPFIEQKLKLK